MDGSLNWSPAFITPARMDTTIKRTPPTSEERRRVSVGQRKGTGCRVRRRGLKHRFTASTTSTVSAPLIRVRLVSCLCVQVCIHPPLGCHSSIVSTDILRSPTAPEQQISSRGESFSMKAGFTRTPPRPRSAPVGAEQLQSSFPSPLFHGPPFRRGALAVSSLTSPRSRRHC